MSTTGWGILGTGRIARGFAADLRQVPGARIAAVGSRGADRAEEFVARHAEPWTRGHGSYQAMVEDPGVDVVYVASPHALHLEHATLALAAGKPVLCEKPLTLTTAEAEEMVERARAAGLFLMEAMWMACHPVIRAVREGLAEGRFGRPRQLHADLGFIVDMPPTDRTLDPSLGAGALLDMGVYPLTLAHLMLGPAVELRAVGVLDERGVDRDLAIAARYRDGAVAALTASMTSVSPRTASIATDRGRIDLPASFHHPAHAVWTPASGEPETVEGVEPLLGSGLGNEAAEVMRCLHEGLVESPLVPHQQTLTVMGQMDTLRRQLGVRYAADG